MKLFLYLSILPLLLLIGCEKRPETLYRLKTAQETGIKFNNFITESDSFNILTEEYIFNGGGVAIGDFNSDDLPDILFTGNQVSNKLYLNKGNLQFEDVSALAGIEAADKWSTGVTVVDINQDGLLDIYVCAAMKSDNRKNMLFVHQGMDEEGIPIFEEQASQYGIAESGNSMAAAFFDFDNDELLDLYVLNNEQNNILPGNYRDKITDGSAINNDQLYRNNGNGTFSNATEEAGINLEGFGLGIAVSDLNQDGWPDIYICNDYLSNDILYINNQDGTFTNKIVGFVRHQSMFSMGVDAADFNNDGLNDFITLDMLGETNFRKKTTIGGESYSRYINNEKWGYGYQHVRNMLQLNNGPGVPFSEIGMMAGVHQTDWSWSPLFIDVDNDGHRDLLVTNGFPRDVTDKDFADYRADVGNIASNKQLLDSMPIVKIPNYAFKNNGDLSFSDFGEQWGLNIPSFSNGAAFVDLDKDGDLDYVVNNINDEAFVFENNLNNRKQKPNYLRIKLVGPSSNPMGQGAKVAVYVGKDDFQYHEHHLARGYMSSVEDVIHFGLGQNKKLSSVKILWPDGKFQEIKLPETNQVLEVFHADAKEYAAKDVEHPFVMKAKPQLLKEISSEVNVDFLHQEKDKVDYNLQRTLPHKLTQFGPSLAVGDINGDRLDDLIIGGAANFAPTAYLQTAGGELEESLNFQDGENIAYEDMGMLLFDADNDGDLDLYVASGSNEFKPGSPEYADRLYLNDGAGNFTKADDALPEVEASGTTVRAADWDGDGYLDLFVGGRTPVGEYPFPDRSFLLKNEGGTFRDATEELAPELRQLGMVTDAIWTDFDQDGWVDLIVVGDYMAITPFKNEGGHFKKSNDSGLEKHMGWWNSIAGGDFDHDGDIDYVVGNMGHNNQLKPSPERPVTVIAKDFDQNGSVDPITFAYFKNDQDEYASFPVHFWKELYGQSTLFRRKYSRYKTYARATQETLLSKKEKEGALVLQGNYASSSYIENLGKGKFKVHELPLPVQMAPVNGLLVDDINGDGNPDILLVGNDYGNDIFVGRLDALTGWALLGNGAGGFLPVRSYESGFLVPGDAKALVSLAVEGQVPYYIASQNRGRLKIFQPVHSNKNPPYYDTPPNVQKVIFHLENGGQKTIEAYYGNGFLSQSSRKIRIPEKTVSINAYDFQGKEISEILPKD